MAIDIMIGRLTVQSYDGEIIKRVTLETNPTAPIGQSNLLTIPRQQFKSFGKATGLWNFFNDPHIGLLRESRQSISLTTDHQLRLQIALTGYLASNSKRQNVYYDYLTWFAWWIDYSLTRYPGSASAFTW